MTRRELLARGAKVTGAVFVVSRAGFGQSPAFALAQVDDDVVLKAMRDEMERSRQLRIAAGGQDEPYFFSFDFTDTEDVRILATLGSPVTVTRQHMRNPGADVRVGS